MLINLAIAALLISSIMATLSQEDMAKALIAENEEDLEKTFKKFKSEQNEAHLSFALANIAKAHEHIPKVITCLRTVVDPFPTEMSHASWFVDSTLSYIAYNTLDDTESFAKVITSFELSDIKLLASIRHLTLRRKDAVKVLESVMIKYPKLITGDLSRWLADHLFDQNSYYYTDFEDDREQAFPYLTSFATDDVLNDALAIATRNEHYKMDSTICCCNSHDSFPQDLYNKLEHLLTFVKDRNVRINETLTFLPIVLVSMVIDYLPASTN